MDDLGDKIKSLLSDKNSFDSILGFAKSLGGNMGANTTPNDESNSNTQSPFSGVSTLLDMPQIKNLFSNNKSERIALLKALKPYIKESKREKVDRITSAMSTLDMLYSAKDIL